eukprot:g18344.t1
MAQRFSRGGVVDAEEPVCFGTMAGDGVDPNAPVAKKRVMLYFRLPKDKKNRAFSAWFEIITDGNVGNFPILLGRPFLDSYSVNVCHDETPPYAVIGQEEVDLFPASNIDMLEIEFIPVGCVNKRNVVTPSIPKPRKSKIAKSSDQNQLDEILNPARTFLAREPMPSMSKVRADGETEYYFDLDDKQRAMLARSYMILAGNYGIDMQNELRDTLDEMVVAAAFASQGSDIRERGALLQYASDKNQLWIADTIKSKLGRAVYVLDACTRLRVSELADDHYGGITGAAVRAVLLMRFVSQGSPPKMIFDEGTEFDNLLFKKVLRSLNIFGHSIGFKSAFRISKLERMNEQHRKNIRKLTVSPYDPHVEALAWSRASHSAIAESLDDVIEQFLATKNDSDRNEIDMLVRRELNAEHLVQMNSTPILGTVLTPYNLNSGGYYSGARDWERLREDLLEDEECKDKLDEWFTAKGKLQKIVRSSIAKKDLQEILRRCELVGRGYKRVADITRLQPGMEVYVRRSDRFRRNEVGTVVTVYEDSADVRINTGVTRYYIKDLAFITLDGEGADLEMYVDDDVGDALEVRVNNYHEDYPFLQDPVSSVRGGVSTQAGAALGEGDFGHICYECNRKFTSRNRLLQHKAEVHGDGGIECIPVPQEERPTITLAAKRGHRQPLDLDIDEDDMSSDDEAPEPPAQPPSSEHVDPMADIPEDEWIETPTHLVRWHYKPRTKSFVPLREFFPDLDFGKLTGERTTHAYFIDEPLVEYKYEDNWKRVGNGRRPSDVLHGQRKWVGRTMLTKVPSMFFHIILPHARVNTAGLPAPQPERGADNNRETVIPSGKLCDKISPWAARFEAAEQAASERLESVLKSHESSSAGDGEPAKKRANTRNMESFYSAAPTCGRVYLAKQDRVINSGHVHRDILAKLQNCVSTMELNIENGQVLLTPAAHGLIGGKKRAYDFSVLPTVSAMLEGKQSHVGRLMHTDKVCWQFSQLLNGREISDELNNKNNIDIDYVVTAVEIGKSRPLQQKYMGNFVTIRWGKSTTPEFVSEEVESWSPVEGDFWVARVYYEVPKDAHEKMQLHTSGHKSSAMEISEETARLLGFESYFVPSVRNEVRAVVKHGIFGESKDKKDVSDKNIMTSRLVVVIKVDLGTGKVSRIKSRWVSRGFQDRRFGGKKGEGLDCRSYTMSDSSFLLLLQFCQAMRSNVWFGDVTEAFLLGLSFLESYGEEYLKDPNSKVWMEVPKTIRGMSEFNFKELVELVKSLYGCKDAPLNWMKTLRRVLAALQMKQSLIDPCLWCSFATEQEERVLQQGKEAVEKYYWERIEEIDKLDKKDIEGAAAIICRQDAKYMNLPTKKKSSSAGVAIPVPAGPAADIAESSNNSQFNNPATEKLAMSLTHHYQHEGTLLGALGSHVDDTCSGGHLLYMLRIYALFRKFPLGSWTKLTPGRRDSFIGRDVQVVPVEVDQHQMTTMVKERKEELERYDIQIADDFSRAADENKLLHAERSFNITRDQKPHTYEKAENLACGAKVLYDGWEMKEGVVFVVSQEAYAQKIKEVTKEEVLEFFKGRDTAKNKWMRKKVENPFRKRIGEILWVTKSNCVIAAAASDLAGGLIKAEQANSWDAVKHYVNDLSGLIMMTSHGESSVRRVARIANIREHYLLGCGDASKSRVGGTLNLAGNLSMRLTLISSFSKIPRRVFSSSTGIELLAQRLLTSELLFALQIALDLHLLSLGTPILQVGDNKNLLNEPNEKNLRLDYQALQQLREEKTLVMKHIPGKQNWSDALTKEPREVVSLLLYLNSVWGIADCRILKVIAAFKESQEKKQRGANEEEIASDGDESESEAEEKTKPPAQKVTGSALLYAALKFLGPSEQQERLDANKWTETEECWYYENSGTPGQKLYLPYRRNGQPQEVRCWIQNLLI